MVNVLLSAILEALGKRKRRLLEGMEPCLPPEMFMVQRKRLLRELGKDEFEKELREIIKQHAARHGKGK
jgi:hypothetical protein